MANNTLAAHPNILAEQVLAGLKGKLPVLSGFSTNLTPTAVGSTMQVSLIGGAAAIEFNKANGGYHEAQASTITAKTVTLKHWHSTKDFSPSEIGEYGEAYIINAFVPEAINQLTKKVFDEVGALFTVANFSAGTVVTAANFGYDDVVDINTALSAAKAGDTRALIVNSAYAGALRKSATLIAPFNTAGQNGPLVTTGQLGQVAGMNVYEFTDLPANNEGLAAVGLATDAVCFAMALPNSSMYPGEVGQAIDASGLSVQVLKSQGTDGIVRLTATIRAGVGVGRSTAAYRICSA